MEAIPYALTVSHFINSVGADAGFAAIIGLALLVVLYFAQARETHSLRDQAADAEDRVAQLEQRVAALTRAQSPAAPPRAGPAPAMARALVGSAAALGSAVPVGSAAAVGAAVGSAAALGPAGLAGAPAGNSAPAQPLMYPGAPAGVGAPALTAATRLIPAHAPQSSTADLTMAAPPPATDRVPGSPPGGQFAPPALADRFGSGLGPVTAAGAANGVARDSVSRPAEAAGQALPPPRVAPRPPPGGAGPSSGGSRGRGSGYGEPSRRRRRVLAVVGVLAAAVVAAVVVIVISSGGASSTNTSATTAAQRGNASKTHRRTSATVAVNPALVTVAVLNGTATPNLAHAIGSRLAAVGYKEGAIQTASDQTQTTTTVGYVPGHRNEALAVASSLKLSQSSVARVNPNNLSVACPPPAPCPAQVVVTVGSNLAAGA